MPPRAPRTSLAGRVAIAIALFVAAAFVANLVHHLLASTLCCGDDAFIAVAAKNLATGRGYASSYGGLTGSADVVRFDPRITTGPTLVVPAAAAIRVLGHRYWVPGATALALSLLLLAGVLAHLAAGAGGPRRWAPAVVVAILVVNLVTLGHYEHWTTLLGEVPALLLIFLGVLRCCDRRGRWRDQVTGGLLLGAAVATKTLAALAVPPVLALLVLAPPGRGAPAAGLPAGHATAAAGRRRLGRGIRAAVVVLAATAVPLLLFEAFKVADLGPAGYLESKRAGAAAFRAGPGSGLGQLLAGGVGPHVRATAARNWQALEEYFGAAGPPLALFVALALGLSARRRWAGRDDPVPLVLAAIAAAHLLWWLPLAGAARVRYALMGLGIGCLGAVFDLFRGTWSARKAALACALAAALLPRAADLATAMPRRPWFEASPRTASMLATARFLAEEREDRSIAADWWASGVDMEYLLPGTGNLVSHLSLAERGDPPVLFLENAKWIDLPPGVRARWQGSLARRGAELVFERAPYRVYAAPPLHRAGRDGS